MAKFSSFKKKHPSRKDWSAPASMSRLTSGAWEKGKTLTDRQKKGVRI